MESTDKSKCCGGEVKVDCAEDFGGDDEVGTCCYICQKCGRACDVEPDSTDWQEKFDELFCDRNGYLATETTGTELKSFIQTQIDASYKRGRDKALELAEKEISCLPRNMMTNDNDHEYIDTCLIYRAIWHIRDGKKLLCDEQLKSDA
jgi:hypothetical protein